MKKMMIIIAALMIAGTVSAAPDMWGYAFTGTSRSANFTLPVATGDLTPYTTQTTGWAVNLMSGTSSLDLTSILLDTKSPIVNAGTFFVTAWSTVGIVEDQSVYYQIVSADGFATLDSTPYILQDVDAPVGAVDLDIDQTAQLDFSGSSWQVVPEPATIGLFGLGALSAWILRRNKMKATKEA